MLQEWKEIQEEKKDYSNLKIGQLSLNDNNHYDDDSELEEDGESGNERSSVVDPWKKVDSTAESGSSQNQLQEASKTTATASKLYISPALRAAQNAVSFLYFFFVIESLHSCHCSFVCGLTTSLQNVYREKVTWHSLTFLIGIFGNVKVWKKLLIFSFTIFKNKSLNLNETIISRKGDKLGSKKYAAS